MREKESFCRENFLSESTLRSCSDLVYQMRGELSGLGFNTARTTLPVQRNHDESNLLIFKGF